MRYRYRVLTLLLFLSTLIPTLPLDAAPLSRNGYSALEGVGRAIHYDPHRMERAALAQQRLGHVKLNWKLNFASLPNCDTLGLVFQMRFRRGPGYAWTRWYTFQQVDCSRPGKDWCTHTKCKWVGKGKNAHQVPTQAWGEIAYELASPLGLAGHGQFDVEIRW